MARIKRILVGVCLSETAPEIFKHAAQLAEHCQADLILSHVINIRDVEDVATIESMGYDVHPEHYVKGVAEERLALMEKLADDSGFPRDRIKFIVTKGHTVERLLDQIEKEKADMVVIGTRGRTHFAHLLVGSVAEKIFRHSPVTVVTYRAKQASLPRRSD